MDCVCLPGVVVGAFKSEKIRFYSLKIKSFVLAYFEIGRFEKFALWCFITTLRSSAHFGDFWMKLITRETITTLCGTASFSEEINVYYLYSIIFFVGLLEVCHRIICLHNINYLRCLQYHYFTSFEH